MAASKGLSLSRLTAQPALWVAGLYRLLDGVLAGLLTGYVAFSKFLQFFCPATL